MVSSTTRLCVVLLATLILCINVNGWSYTTKKLAKLSRKNFIAGIATGIISGTIATAAIAIDPINDKKIYQPPSGSLNDKIILITGGSTGLGLESAKRLAAAGATIVLTSRNLEKGQTSVEAVKSYLQEKGSENNKIYSLVLDLDDLESVKSFPKLYSKLGLGDIDVLMNNAGTFLKFDIEYISSRLSHMYYCKTNYYFNHKHNTGVMAIPDLQTTKDGYERTFQSNHLGHFVLTSGLFPLLSRKKATIINVSSEAYQFTGGKFDIDNLNAEKKYPNFPIYYSLQNYKNVLMKVGIHGLLP